MAKVFLGFPYAFSGEYRAAVRAAVRSVGHEPVVADDHYTGRHVFENIEALLLEDEDVKLAIFDITGLNSNVLIEVGYSMGIGIKKILILNLSQHLQTFGIVQSNVPPPIPEDLAGVQRFQYDSVEQIAVGLPKIIDQAIADTLGDWERFELVALRIASQEPTTISKVQRAAEQELGWDVGYQNTRNWLERMVRERKLIKRSGKPNLFEPA